MTRLAIATCARLPALFEEEGALPSAFKTLGIEARPVVWSDPTVDWAAFDAVLLRSTWDYVERYAEFLAWIARLERARIALINPAPLVRWNADKSYLEGLGARGIATIPTVFLKPSPGRPAPDLATILRDRGWPRAILKPLVSAGSRLTVRFDATQAATHQADADALVGGADAPGAMLQPYLSEIESSGELSFLFFGTGTEPDFAVAKRPAAGDFRVQFTHGGTFKAVTPDGPHVAAARAVIESLPSRPAYARVDGVVTGGRFLLMEVELIEPYLYLAAKPDAKAEMTARFAVGMRDYLGFK